MTHTHKPANRKSISFLQEEIDYFREENHAKTQIIKQFTNMKVVPSNSDLTAGACSWKVASTQSFCVDNSYKEHSIDLETNAKSNKNLDKIRNQQNKNVTEKLDSDNINEKNKKRDTVQGITPRKKRKRTRKIKDMKMARKLETLKTMYLQKSRKLYIF